MEGRKEIDVAAPVEEVFRFWIDYKNFPRVIERGGLSMITVAGIFDSRADAEGALERLRTAGIADEHLTLLTPGAPDAEVEAQVLNVETAEPHGGEKVGGALGRGLGIAGGIMIGGVVGSYLVPGGGAVLAAGALAAALLGVSGRAAGRAAGHVLDEAVIKARLHDELHIFEEALRSGRTVVVALAEAGGQAEAAGAELARVGALSLERAREVWWEGLRTAEAEEYARRGQDFAADESIFRRGFEAALHPRSRGRGFDEAEDFLRERYGDDLRSEAFRRGYERGQAHHQRLAGESRREELQGGRSETPAAGRRDSAEPDPAERESEPVPPDDDEQPNASTEGLSPQADPGNWVEHED